eukprot:CAMPEP_0179146538 /NCGR_PEP_ID=MMETSP0796-20121207/70765_1 /TAXON_ID=73915 /ORGANISM="Pyrodinium bahamense, Strain pbaha01" /LENGTH=143 /DNA_ID=CAMNT_0020847019 /DNA_START=201 /DNA_END=633 /DNA_ORIENTATION=-
MEDNADEAVASATRLPITIDGTKVGNKAKFLEVDNWPKFKRHSTTAVIRLRPVHMHHQRCRQTQESHGALTPPHRLAAWIWAAIALWCRPLCIAAQQLAQGRLGRQAIGEEAAKLRYQPLSSASAPSPSFTSSMLKGSASLAA